MGLSLVGMRRITLSDEKTNDQRRIAKALVVDSIRELLEEANDFYGGHISYKDNIETLFFCYPFLQEEQILMFEYLEARGAIIDGKPPRHSLPKQTHATYFTEEERIEARKKSQIKYKTKKKIQRINETVNSVNISRFDNWEDSSHDEDIQKYLRHKL